MIRLLWLLCFGLSCLSALLFPHPVLLSGASAFLLAPLISWLCLLPCRKKARLCLQAPAVASKGQPFCLELHMAGKSFAIGSVSVRLRLHNLSTGQQTLSRLCFRDAGSAELCSDYCGCVVCEVTRVWAWDVFGIFPMPLVTRGKKRILVMPDTFPVEPEHCIPPGLADSCTEYAPDRRGTDRTETFQIREYVPGDPLQQIHWKLSSKWDKLTVREPAQPLDRELTIFLEQSGQRTPAQTDGLLEAVTSVCQTFAENGIPFRLAWNGESIQFFEVTGREQLPEAIGALLKAERCPTGLSGTALCRNSGRAAMTGYVLYFCAQWEEDPFPWANTRIFLCGEGEHHPATVFTPENAPEVFKGLSFFQE